MLESRPWRGKGQPLKTGPDLHLYGSGGGDRTHDLRINSPTLCQLSYPGKDESHDTSAVPAREPETGTEGTRLSPREGCEIQP